MVKNGWSFLAFAAKKSSTRLLKNGLIHAFGIEFPASAKPFYAPIVERIEDTFRARVPASASLASDKEEPRKVWTLDSIPNEEHDPLVIY